MGFYLNNAAPGALYKSETESPYFVDKSQLLEETEAVWKNGYGKHDWCFFWKRL